MNTAAPILETPRLQLRPVVLSDSPFIFKLLNDPSWLENIGDRGVRSEADAGTYITDKLWAHYGAHGYGTYVVQLKSTASSIGVCGLVKREFLPAPDLGFALLPACVGQGYAFEAASGLMSYARGTWSIDRLYAIVKRGNHRSLRLLGRLGFHHEGPCLTPQGEEVELHHWTREP
jgi:RimJ/RimL family protein N-acetyltransferase